MSNFLVANAQNLQQYLKATGSGTDLDPYKIVHSVEGALTDAELRATPIAVSGTLSQLEFESAVAAAIAEKLQNENILFPVILDAVLQAFGVTPGGTFFDLLKDSLQDNVTYQVSVAGGDVNVANPGDLQQPISDALLGYQANLKELMDGAISDFFQGTGYWGTLEETLRNSFRGTVYTAWMVNVTSAGQTSGGNVISFANNGSISATVGGASLPPGASVDFVAPLGGSIEGIDYDATGTELIISIVSE